MGNTNAPILDLDVLVVRPTIKVGGQLYEMYTKAELGIVTLRRVYHVAQEGEKLLQAMGPEQSIEALTDESAQRLEDLIDDLLSIAFVKSYREELKDKLTLEQKTAVMQAFSMSSLGVTTDQPGTEAASTSTGVKS